MERISVIEYLQNPGELELNYTPYNIKAEIVDVILSQVITENEMKKIDSALLDRVSTQIFIESATNIDMSIESEEGLDGYDLLCLNDELDHVIFVIGTEFDRFKEILDLKVADFYRYENSTSATLLLLKRLMYTFMKKKVDEARQLVEGVDTKAVAERMKVFLNAQLERDK
jgi:hypothetical protein